MAINRWFQLFKFIWHKINSQLGLSGWLGIVAFLIGSLVLWQTNQLVKQIPTLAEKVSKKKSFLSAQPSLKNYSAGELRLPKVDEYEHTLKNIILLTEKHSISLVGGSYTVKTLQNSRVTIVEITFPLSGSYLQCKHFLAELLNTIPNSSLQAVRLSQPNKANEILDAEAILLLYFLGNSNH